MLKQLLERNSLESKEAETQAKIAEWKEKRHADQAAKRADRADVNASFLQPWLYYNFPSGAYIF